MRALFCVSMCVSVRKAPTTEHHMHNGRVRLNTTRNRCRGFVGSLSRRTYHSDFEPGVEKRLRRGFRRFQDDDVFLLALELSGNFSSTGVGQNVCDALQDSS